MKTTLYLFFILFLGSCTSQQLAVVKQNGKFGCINKKGDYIIKPNWDYILLDSLNKPILVQKDSLYGYINRKGEILIQPKFSDAELFSEGLAMVANSKGKYGYINLAGDLIIDFKYEENAWGEFSNGLADVILNKKSGYINKNGKIKIPIQYKICYPFRSDIAVIIDTAHKNWLINKEGKLFEYNMKNIDSKDILPPAESYPGSISTITGQGRINKLGDTIVPPIYNVTGNLREGMYIVKDKNEKWGAYNENGELVVDIIFDNLSHFNEGLANFKLDNKWGYVNKKGIIKIGAKYDNASVFINGLAYVELNGKSGFINNKGKIIIPIIYEPYEWSYFK